MDLEHINNSIDNINIKYNKIKTKYEKLYSEIPNLTKCNIILPYENLILLEISLDDFANQLESIFLFIKFEINDLKNKKLLEQQNNVDDTEYDDNDTQSNVNDTNKLVDKTIKNMLPLFFFYLMMIDDNSILNSKTFGNSNISNILNGEPKINENNIISEISEISKINETSDINTYNYLNIELD